MLKNKGRPAKPKEEHRQSITIRLPPDLILRLNKLPKNVKGRFIEEAIKDKLNNSMVMMNSQILGGNYASSKNIDKFI